MPRRASRYGGSPVTSAPPYRIAPVLGRRKPEMSANNVVLPAPLGPISAVMRPCGALSDTSLTASRPPKRRETRSTRNSGSAMAGLRQRRRTHRAMAPLRKPADQPARRKPDDQHQDAAVNHEVEAGRVAAGHQLRALTQATHQQRADQRTEHRADAADDRRQQRLDRDPGAVGQTGIDEEKILDVETAGRRGDRPGYHHCDELDRRRIHTKRRCGVLVLAHRNEPEPEPRALD